MASLTGNSVASTYQSLIKVSDNSSVGSTLENLTDGLGNTTSVWVSSDAAAISGSFAVSGSTTLSGSVSVVGNLTTTGTITGTLSGTAATASLAQTASYVALAQSASYVANAVSASYSATASYVVNAISSSNAATAVTASYIANAVSSSYALTASFALNGESTNTGSLLLTASVSSNTITFTKGDNTTFNVTVNTGSAVTTNTGSLIVTASATNNVLTFTKGDNTTFNVTVDTGSAVLNLATGSLIVTASATNNTLTFTKGDNTTFNVTVNTGSVDLSYFATTGSNTFIGQQTISGSVQISGSIIPATDGVSVTSSFSLGSATNAWKDIFVSNGTINFLDGAGNVQAALSSTAEGLAISGALVVSEIVAPSGSVGSYTGSLEGTASFATVANSATTASYVQNAQTASYALNAASASHLIGNTSLITASVAASTITFTKADNTTFDIVVAQSGSIESSSYSAYAVTSSFAQTASYYAIPVACYAWNSGYGNLTNSTDNNVKWDTEVFNTRSDVFELSGSGTTDARIYIKQPGYYEFVSQVHLYDLTGNMDLLIKLTSGSSTGALGLVSLLNDSKFAENSADQATNGTIIVNVGSAGYYSVAINPSANTPFPSNTDNTPTRLFIKKLA